MIKQFPEIKQFFEQKSTFTQNELEEFIQKIDEIYPTKDINHNAQSLIKLELFKYQIIAETEEITSKNKRPRIQSKSKKKINSPKPDKIKRPKRDPFEDQNNWVNESLLKMRSMSINQISELLNVNTNRLINIITRKTSLKLESDLISNEILEILKEYAKNRLIIVYRQNKLQEIEQFKIIKFKSQLSQSTNSVYSELQLYGPGKLIYIRSK